ncbi:formylmethanofuran dehydrogenase subunit B [Thalassoglobus polymorphus]|uniref:Molybdopterin oxidoreductase n=1 Tax=Thalassoglobus polymorphus TaxID=2527994 RepID=A0A517QPM5_9PLAN|nr:formylmethanofuran dehydrogenase subunit B [Thalassoglobus polymorphus]QDT33590.1 Molybdopterin oxidoreductase [Thalassoglobus polymorphus]
MPESPTTDQLEILQDVACTLCGCVCDDLRIGVQENQIQTTENACALAEPWLLRQNQRQQQHPEINGDPASLSESYQTAAELIRNSRTPLVYGLCSSSVLGQQVACELADRIGAVIDTTASTSHTASVMALQRIGESTASLGEIRYRSDLIIFWGSNPAESHPRHLERFCGTALGDGRQIKRDLIVIDTVLTETAKQADLFIQINPGQDFEVLWALRGLLNGIELTQSEIGGVPLQTLEQLADRMKASQYAALFYGSGLAQGTLPHSQVEAILSLATDLHQHTRCVVRGMRGFGDVGGAANVLSWQTGYPFSVNFHRGYPRYNPGEYSAAEMLSRQEPDLAILVGTDGLDQLPQEAINWLQTIPTVLLSHEDCELPFQPTVLFPVATCGVHLSGTTYRMDDTPIPLRPILQTNLPDDATVLREVLNLIKQIVMSE